MIASIVPACTAATPVDALPGVKSVEQLWEARKALVRHIRGLNKDMFDQIKCESDAANREKIAFDHDQAIRSPLLRIDALERDIAAAPNSLQKLGALLLIELESVCESASETINDRDDAERTVQQIAVLAEHLVGSIAADVGDLLEHPDRPIRALACLCP